MDSACVDNFIFSITERIYSLQKYTFFTNQQPFSAIDCKINAPSSIHPYPLSHAPPPPTMKQKVSKPRNFIIFAII